MVTTVMRLAIGESRCPPRDVVGSLTHVSDMSSLSQLHATPPREEIIPRLQSMIMHLRRRRLQPFHSDYALPRIHFFAPNFVASAFALVLRRKMGFKRQLTSVEIFEQAYRFAQELAAKGERLSNVASICARVCVLKLNC